VRGQGARAREVAILQGCRQERDGVESRREMDTRGTRGAVLTHGGRRWVGRAETRADAVDTLGAGDTFAARALIGLLTGEPPEHLLAAAATAAADTCSHLGAFGHGVALEIASLRSPQKLPEAG